jgi:hypothetical protein
MLTKMCVISTHWNAAGRQTGSNTLSTYAKPIYEYCHTVRHNTYLCMFSHGSNRASEGDAIPSMHGTAMMVGRARAFLMCECDAQLHCPTNTVRSAAMRLTFADFDCCAFCCVPLFHAQGDACDKPFSGNCVIGGCVRL